jgi:hypothetical protein
MATSESRSLFADEDRGPVRRSKSSGFWPGCFCGALTAAGVPYAVLRLASPWLRRFGDLDPSPGPAAGEIAMCVGLILGPAAAHFGLLRWADRRGWTRFGFGQLCGGALAVLAIWTAWSALQRSSDP